MAQYYGNNYSGAYVDEPREKYPPGEYSGEIKNIIERFTLTDGSGAGLNLNDVIEVGKLPPNSMVVDAKIYINKSLGATGIFSLGTRASTDENGVVVAEDADGIIVSADAGGQAVLALPTSASVKLFKRFGEETGLFVTCTEVMDDSVIDAELIVQVEYINK